MIPPPIDTVAPRLPRLAGNDDLLYDSVLSQWQFEAEQSSWIMLGLNSWPGVVTTSSDGLVSPPIQLLINRVRGARADALALGVDIGRPLKLLPNDSAYWHLMSSLDRLISFSVEGVDRLRLEVNRSRLYEMFCRLAGSCIGPVGPQGAVGLAGSAGVRRGPEPCLPPSSVVVAPGSVSISATIATPLTTDISVRIYRDSVNDPYAPLATLIYGISGSSGFTVNTGDIAFDTPATLASLSFKGGLLSASFILVAGTFDPATPWCVRATQKGPTGQAGSDAPCLFNVVRHELDQAAPLATSPFVYVRVASDTQLKYFAQPLSQDNCVAQLSIADDSLLANIATRDTVAAAKFAALRQTIETCKGVATWSFATDDQLTLQPLELPEWTPTPQCESYANYASYKFDWVPKTNCPTGPPAPPAPSVPMFSLLKDLNGKCSCADASLPLVAGYSLVKTGYLTTGACLLDIPTLCG